MQLGVWRKPQEDCRPTNNRQNSKNPLQSSKPFASTVDRPYCPPQNLGMPTNAAKKLTLTTVLLSAVLALSPLSLGTAHAEGSFTSYMTQVQPLFYSRTWKDSNTDSTSTVVTLSNCKTNRGGAAPGTSALQSVGVSLYRGGTHVSTITQKCGTYNFGRQRSGDYRFRIASINGSRLHEGKYFLNASVAVKY